MEWHQHSTGRGLIIVGMVFYIGQPQHIDQRDNGQQPQWRGSSYPVAGTHTMMVPVAKYIKWILKMALISWQMMTGK